MAPLGRAKPKLNPGNIPFRSARAQTGSVVSHSGSQAMRLSGAQRFILGWITTLVFSGCHRDSAQYIDFNRTAGAASSNTHGDEKIRRPVFIAIASVISPSETIGAYRQIAHYVTEQTGRPTSLIQRKTYAEVNQLLANGDVDLAFISTGAYCSYRGMNEIEILVMAEHAGNSSYTPEIIVHADSRIRSLHDLQGKVFAFTDPLSFSGHMAILDSLRKMNTVPEKFFQRYFYTYSHDKSIWAVANKVADGASLDSQMYDYVKWKNPELIKDIRIITTMDPAPTGPVVVNKNLRTDQKERYRQLFLHMNEAKELRGAFNTLMIDRFIKANPAVYAPLRELYERASGIQ
jgi:phosphonate transport system substrate-binding protein